MVCGVALPVHQAHGHIRASHRFQRALALQRIDVVDHVRAGIDRCAHHLGFAGIHRQRHVACRCNASMHRQHPPQLLVDTDGCAPGRVDSPPISRMSAPSSSSRKACAIAGSGGRMTTAIGKRVGRDIDDAHDQRAIERKGEAAAVKNMVRSDE